MARSVSIGHNGYRFKLKLMAFPQPILVKLDWKLQIDQVVNYSPQSE
ncbi:MAG: hypothetical protein WCA35_22460 [Kovacikia sp.]